MENKINIIIKSEYKVSEWSGVTTNLVLASTNFTCQYINFKNFRRFKDVTNL